MSPTSTEAAANAPVRSAGGSHHFVIEYYTLEGRRLGPVPVEPDFQPAREWAWLEGVRRGLLEPVTIPAAGAIEPVWSPEHGSPYCDAIRVVASDEGQVSSLISKTYFRDLANEHATVWVERKELQPGERFHYRLCAYPLAAERLRPGDAPEIQIEGIAEPIRLTPSDLESFLARSEAFGVQHADDAPVFIPQEVLDQACTLAAEAGALETGGVLVGRLHRDADKPEVFIEVTAQIPAQHAEASGASFGFTPETWAAANAAIELRGGGDESICGWFHSHPKWCRNCPPERQRDCALARSFFSPDDIHLHRTCFGRAHQIALLISDLPEAGPTPALFGWREGTVVPRGFHAVQRRH
ncbi:MAG: hypothetical protein JRH16_18270 [Deltaproteobacteria bacterium]|nr:hypothetical protein [Deltaproteobacteria bacterium]MBW2362724.1 hypothetical protein [Deltaproteobacteria bacterium]